MPSSQNVATGLFLVVLAGSVYTAATSWGARPTPPPVAAAAAAAHPQPAQPQTPPEAAPAAASGWARSRGFADAAKKFCGVLPSAAGREDYATFVSEVCESLRCWCRHKQEMREAAPGGRYSPNNPKTPSPPAAASATSRRLLGRRARGRPKGPPLRRFLVEKLPAVDENPFAPWPRNMAPSCTTCSSPLLALLELELPVVDGLWMQFGVYKGQSLRPTVNSYTIRGGRGDVFAFDTFGPGLPENWVSGIGKGFFRMSDGGRQSVFASMPLRSRPVVGFFNESIPPFLASTAGDASLIDIDCDLYQGAADALNLLNERIRPGTALHFDELVAYNGYMQNEIKALWEWLRGHKRRVVPAAWFGSQHPDGGCGRLQCGEGGVHSNLDVPKRFRKYDIERFSYGKYPTAAAFIVVE